MRGPATSSIKNDGGSSVGVSFVGTFSISYSSVIETNATICQKGMEADNEGDDDGDSGCKSDGHFLLHMNTTALIENLQECLECNNQGKCE